MIKRFARWVLRDERDETARLLAYGAWYLKQEGLKPALRARMRKQSFLITHKHVDATDSQLFNGVLFGDEVAAGTITAEKLIIKRETK